MGAPNDEISHGKDVPEARISEDTGEVLAAKSAVKAVVNGDAKNVDVAAQILAEYGEEFDRTWTPEEEKRLIRKVDWMIVPIVSCPSFLEFQAITLT